MYGKPLGNVFYVESENEYYFGYIVDFDPSTGEATILTFSGPEDENSTEPVLRSEITRKVPAMKFQTYPCFLPTGDNGFYLPSSDPKRVRLGFVMSQSQQGVYTIKLPKKTWSIVFQNNLVTGDGVGGEVNGTSISNVPFNTSNAQTLTDLATQIAGFDSVASAVSDGVHTITVESNVGLDNENWYVAVQNGNSQLAANLITVTGTQDVQAPSVSPVSLPAWWPMPIPSDSLNETINDWFKNNP